MLVAWACALCGACGPSEPAARRPDVLLVSIDTLRADHLGCYGYERQTSPWIDRLAASGVLFEQAHSQATATLTSHASLLTSLYPPQLALTRDDGTNSNQHLTTLRIADAAQTLAEVFSQAGYDTAAFTGGAMTAPHYGFDQGFDEYHAARGSEEADVQVRVEQVRSWLAARRLRGDDDPVFLFVHSFDVHDPYGAPPPVATMFSSGTAVDFTKRTGCPPMAPAMRVKLPDPPPEIFEEVVGLYDNGIRHMDRNLARLQRLLEQNGRWGETVVVVLSDHGEEFLDHGSWGHGPTVYGELTHVPLVLRLPGDDHAGLRVSQPVPLVDVAPTLIDAAGLRAPGVWEGRSLLPLVRGETPADAEERLVYSDIPNAELGLRAVRRGRWKLVDDPRRELRELYDLSVDPREQVDVAAQHPELVAELEAALADWLAARMAGAAPFAGVVMDDPSQTLDATHMEQLRQLGYVK